MRRVRAFAATKCSLLLEGPHHSQSSRYAAAETSTVLPSVFPHTPPQFTAPGMATRRARASRYFSSEARWTGLARSWNIGDAWEQQAVDGIRQRFVLRWFNL